MSEDGAQALLTPKDLKRIADDVEAAQLQAALARRLKQQAEEVALERAFMERDIETGPKGLERLNDMVRRAVEQGKDEVQVLRFPAKFCSDHGRAINNFDADWPTSLTGVALKAYEAFEQHLQPLGYRLRAQVLDYPDGQLGEVGLFLSW